MRWGCHTQAARICPRKRSTPTDFRVCSLCPTLTLSRAQRPIASSTLRGNRASCDAVTAAVVQCGVEHHISSHSDPDIFSPRADCCTAAFFCPFCQLGQIHVRERSYAALAQWLSASVASTMERNGARLLRTTYRTSPTRAAAVSRNKYIAAAVARHAH